MPLPDSPYPTEVPCTKAEILETLHNWIILMQMKPGEKISDTELADYFHVSRTPVREVLKILEQQKLILTYPGKATVVADLDLDKMRHSLIKTALKTYTATPTEADYEFLAQETNKSLDWVREQVAAIVPTL